MTRRTALSLLGTASLAHTQSTIDIDPEIIKRNDEAVDSYIERQNTDAKSRWLGAIPDATGLHEPGSASGVLVRGIASYLHPISRHHGEPELMRRMLLAADHLKRAQTPDGNVDLLVTNFNSPPDTAFVMLNVGTAAQLARKHNATELFARMEPFIRKSGEALLKGGVHTPNHRWVVCAALSHVHSLFPAESYRARIEQWLAEGIDIDADGQYSEQSTTVYNPITNNALVTVAKNLDMPELLEPVRKNLDTMLYLMHPNYEVVTEISRRQDRNSIGDMGRYWYALRYLARKDGNGVYETLTRAFEPRNASLADLMAYPELSAPAPQPKDPPSNYEKFLSTSKLHRIRRGQTSASLILSGNSRFFALRRGDAVINGVRFASAFFGKGQFVPESGRKVEERFVLEQSLEAAYYQPFEPSRKQPWGVDSWYKLRPGREATEINRMRYRAEVRERSDGFDVRIHAEGAAPVPVAVEINLREGGKLEGVTPAPGVEDAFLLAGKQAVYRMGSDVIRFGPGLAETAYTEVRGAEPKLPGPSVYITGYTPFDHTIEFRW